MKVRWGSYSEGNAATALLVIRLAVGLPLFLLGLGKLTGFAGPGLRFYADQLAALGIASAAPLAAAAALVQTLAGLLLMAGFLTSEAAAAALLVALAGLFRNYLMAGLPGTLEGWVELVVAARYHLALMGALIALLIMGPGSASLDASRLAQAYRRTSRKK